MHKVDSSDRFLALVSFQALFTVSVDFRGKVNVLFFQSFYSQCFGSENVQMLKDSSTVNVESLDASKAYIQITYVEPYFHEYEDQRRITYFQR